MTIIETYSIHTMEQSEIPKQLKFPRTTRLSKWRHYLGRELTFHEQSLIADVHTENEMNKMMDDLYTHCDHHKMYVPILTEMDGNCLFETLNYHKIGKNVESLRKGMAWLMYLCKDSNIFPNQEETLEQLFTPFNEVEYVLRRTPPFSKDAEYQFNKYTYNVMVQDMTTDGSWGKLPTQLVLMVISHFYNVKINILCSDTGYVETINVNKEEDNVRSIWIGLLGESHYLPIEKLMSDEEMDPMYYSESRRAFFKWGLKMENYMFKYYLKQQQEQQQQQEQYYGDYDQPQMSFVDYPSNHLDLNNRVNF